MTRDGAAHAIVWGVTAIGIGSTVLLGSFFISDFWGFVWWVLMGIFFIGTVATCLYLNHGLMLLIRSIARLTNSILEHKYPTTKTDTKKLNIPNLSDQSAKRQ